MPRHLPPPAFSLDFLEPGLRPAFVALLANRLADLITEDSARTLRARKFRTPAICVSTVMYLHANGPASMADLARAYGEQHQLVTLRVTALEAARLVRRSADPLDGRRRLIHLTVAGQREATRLEAHLALLSTAVADLSAELQLDLVDALQRAVTHLHTRSLSDRVDALRGNA